MANFKRLFGVGVGGTLAFYYSPWLNAKVDTFFRDTATGYSWEQVKLKSEELKHLRSASRSCRDPWYCGDRSRLNYYMFGEDTLLAPGGDLAKGKGVVEDFIEYTSKSRIRTLGPWFDAFSDPNSKALIDEYSRQSPYKALERHMESDKLEYEASFGGAKHPKGIPRGASITAFCYEVEGWPEFHEKLQAMEKENWERLEYEIEDPKVREQIKDSVDAFKIYWGEQLEEYLPFIACRPKQKEKLAKFYMNEDPNYIASLALQKDGFKKILLAAGVDISYDS